MPSLIRLLLAASICLAAALRADAQSPRGLYSWSGTGNTFNWIKNFGTNDITLSNATAGSLTIQETGLIGSEVAFSDGFNTISEARAAITAGGIDLTGIEFLEIDMGHNGAGLVDVQFFTQVGPNSTYVAFGLDQAIASGMNTYVLSLEDTLTADQRAYVRTFGVNVRDHFAEGNLTWTLDEVRSVGMPLTLRDFATHEPGTSDAGLQGAIVNFENSAVQGNDGGQNQTGLVHNIGPIPIGNTGSLRWTDLAIEVGAAVSYGNGTAFFNSNTYYERPTDMSNYDFVRVRMAATNDGGAVESLGLGYFLQTGNFNFFQIAPSEGMPELPADGEFHVLTFPLAGIPDLDVVMQHGVNLFSHPEGNLIIDIDNIQAVSDVGDMDFDLDVDFDDIDDFVLGLNDAALYESIFGAPPSLKGDTDMDGDFDFDDIAGFVAILSGAEINRSIPEPSLLALTGTACAVLAVWIRRHSKRGR